MPFLDDSIAWWQALDATWRFLFLLPFLVAACGGLSLLRRGAGDRPPGRVFRAPGATGRPAPAARAPVARRTGR